MIEIDVKKVSESEVGITVFCSILMEATRRMEGLGMPMWPEESLTEEKLSGIFTKDEMHIGYADNKPAFAFTLLESDDRYWGEGSGNQNALYIHKIAVTDAFTGKGMPEAIVEYAINQAKLRGKTKLRLDTRASRPKLQELYERLGFVRHHQAYLFDWYEGIFYEININEN